LIERAVPAGDRGCLLAVCADSRCEELLRLGSASQQLAMFVETQFGFQPRSFETRYPAAITASCCEGEGEGEGRSQRQESRWIHSWAR